MPHRARRPSPPPTAPALDLALGLALGLLLILAVAPRGWAAGEPASAWTGTVVGQGDQPLAGARVSVERWPSLHEEQRRQVTGEPPRILAADTSGADGGFRVSPPTDESVVVRIGAPGHETLVLPVPESSFRGDFGQVTLPPGEGLGVRVVNGEGEAVAHARVHLSGHISSRHWIADRDGRLVTPGERQWRRAEGVEPFRALPPRGRADLAPSAPFASGEGVATVTLPAARPRVLVVRREDGSPAPGVLVRVADGRDWRQYPPLTLTGEDGRATVPQPLDGPPLELHLMAADLTWARLELGPPEDAEEGGDGGAGEGVDDPIPVTLRPPAGATLRVQAAGGGEAVTGAKVWILGAGSRPTDPRGELELRWPVGRRDQVGGVWGQATAPGFRPTQIAFDLALESAAPSLDQPLVVRMPRDNSLGGRVLDPEGLPVEGARVLLLAQSARYPSSGFNGPEAEATGADGRFLVKGLPSHRPFLLRVEAPGFAPTEQPTPGLDDGEARRGVEITVRPGRRASVTVLGADETPVAGARVELSPHAAGGGDLLHGPPVACGEDGVCEVSGLSPGRFDLRAEAPGHAPGVVRGVEVPAEAGEAPVDLGTVYLEPAVDLAGRVTTAAGAPVADARVRAFPPQHLGGHREPPSETRSSQDGRFLLTGFVAGQSAHLVAEAEGYAPTVLPAVEAPATDLDLSLVPGAVLAGVVVDSAGEPVTNALLSVSPAEPSILHLDPGHNSASTDSAGHFELTDLPAGKVVLRLHRGAGTTQAFDLRPGEERRDLRLRMEGVPKPFRVSGHVLDAAGEPISGALVTLQGIREGLHTSGGTVTREDGKFELSQTMDTTPSGASSWELHADHPEFLEERLRLGTDPDLAGVEKRLEIVLTAGGTTVAGTVVGADGEPLAAATVVLERPQDAAGFAPRQGMSGDSVSSVTGSDGGFLFEGVEPGSWEIFARHPDWVDGGLGEPLAVGATPVTGLRVVLERGAVLRGRVTGLEPRHLASVQISATSVQRGGYHSLSGQPDYSGEFILAGAKPGRWRIQAFTSERGRSLQKTVEIAPGDREVEVSLEFTDGYELTGTLSVNGVPRPGARLGLHRPGDHRTAITGPEGRFRFTDVEEGDYTLSTSGPSFHREITVRGDDEIRLDVVTAIIAGLVVDGAQRPVEATVELEPVDTAEAIRTSQSGRSRFRFEVPSGSYRLHVHASGYLPQEVELWAGGTAAENLELVLERGDEVTLHLSTDGGLPPSRVLVAVASEPHGEERGGWHPVGPEGRAQVSGLRQGTSRLLVSIPGHATVATEVEVPGPPVTVHLPAATRLRVEAPSLADVRARVHVLDAGGRPLATFNPAIQVVAHWWLVDGFTEITGLPPGRWALEIRAGDRPAHLLPVTLTAGATTEVTLP